MKLIVGLGNPGIKYKKTRHNVGFRVIDEIAANFQFQPYEKQQAAAIFNFQPIFNAQISKGIFKRQKIILAKPRTYMNNSGQAVKSLTKNYKLKTKNLLVIHDDLDLALGKFKLQKGRGSAGHKGVQSIIDALGTKDFWRLRIGIKPVDNEQQTMNNVEKFVLGKFTKKEEKIIQKTIKEALKILNLKL